MQTEKIQRKEAIGVCLMLVCAVCLCTGQFIWKYYGNIFSVFIGFGIYGIGAVAMLCAYRFGSLSVLQPINSISYVIAAILGSIFFDEAITIGKVAGIAMIMVGVVFLARGDAAK